MSCQKQENVDNMYCKQEVTYLKHKLMLINLNKLSAIRWLWFK